MIRLDVGGHPWAGSAGFDVTRRVIPADDDRRYRGRARRPALLGRRRDRRPVGWMYLLLQMEDYVLVAGSLGLFAALVTVMYVTRNIDWYRVGQPVETDGEAARSG